VSEFGSCRWSKFPKTSTNSGDSAFCIHPFELGVELMKWTCGIAFLFFAALGLSQAGEPIALFDGKDTSRFYTWLKEHGKDKDPNGNFTVKDGVLRIAGRDWGGLVSREEFSNYRIEVEFAWGGKVWPPREKVARDCGLLVHSTGPDGKVGGSWQDGFQVNMIEGGTGDLSITGSNKQYLFKAQAEERPWGKKTGKYWKEGAKLLDFPPATRLLWFDRDPAWENVIDFRGKNDVEKPLKQWNRLVVELPGNSLEAKLNGVTVSKASGLTVSKGKIQFQSEGAECLIRRVMVTPLD